MSALLRCGCSEGGIGPALGARLGQRGLESPSCSFGGHVATMLGNCSLRCWSRLVEAGRHLQRVRSACDWPGPLFSVVGCRADFGSGVLGALDARASRFCCFEVATFELWTCDSTIVKHPQGFSYHKLATHHQQFDGVHPVSTITDVSL